MTGVPSAIDAPSQTVISAGAVIVGFTLSVTVTVWDVVDMFALPSVTVQRTVVLPKGNAAGALFVTATTVQLSAVTGVPSVTPVAVHPEIASLLPASVAPKKKSLPCRQWKGSEARLEPYLQSEKTLNYQTT